MNDAPRKISIAGDIGGGKSTVGKLLAARLGCEMISTGAIQRRMAASQGKSSLELNKVAEGDRSIDRQIDDFLVSLNGRTDAVVIESRMAWHFVKTSFKVYLFCLAEKAAERIRSERRADETYADTTEAIDKIAMRRASEIKRFKDYYDVDIENLRNYDVVVDTSYIAPNQAVETIQAGLPYVGKPLVWASPYSLIPTKSVRDLSIGSVARLSDAIHTGGFDPRQPLTLLFVGRRFYIADGHARAAAAIKAKQALVPAVVIGIDDEPVRDRPSARELVRQRMNSPLVREWEEATGFHFDFKVVD